MFRPQKVDPATRRGIILLVVLALLTLFAIVGISFVLYASSQANSSRNFREGEAPTVPDMDAELLFSYFLGQLIYDTDDVSGVYSAMRGHSLARNMYGFNCNISQPGPGSPPVVQPVLNGNNLPFSGVGRFHITGPLGADEFSLINYTFFRSDPTSKLRDPERMTFRTSPNQPYVPINSQGDSSYIPFNPSYTYPDLNNMFLAAVKAGKIAHPSDPTKDVPPGAVLIQSFHRPWLFGSLTDANNPNWKSTQGKYRLLRPRKADMAPDFPDPEDEGGDVKNLLGSPGFYYWDDSTKWFRQANNDSIWMDLGAPVMLASDGTKYKPLFAPLILDLDNRLNVNVHGNLRRQNNNDHASNQGWGPWEVNLKYVLDYINPGPGSIPEWQSQFLRQPSTNLVGRYGSVGPAPNFNRAVPTTQAYAFDLASSGQFPHFYAPVDYDACDNTGGNLGPSGPVSRPPDPNMNNNYLYTVFGNYGNGYLYLDNTAERQYHPSIFNFFNPQTKKDATGTFYDVIYPISNMEALLRYGETNSPGLTSELFRLTPTNYGEGGTNGYKGPMHRNLVTTHSFGFDRAAVTPWNWDANTANAQPRYELEDSPNYPRGAGAPNFGPIPFPQVNQKGNTKDYSEFRKDTWQAMTTALQRIDLNRELFPYPTQAAAQPYNYDPNGNAVQVQFDRAQKERQNLALDIYKALIAATGAYDPLYYTALNPPSDKQVNALRWLAQLAVNIVDFIDSDDIITPFNWAGYGNPQFIAFINNKGMAGHTWVFGTELPRVVINEAYAEFTRPKPTDDPNLLDVQVWAELHNPFFDKDDPQLDPNKGSAWLQWPALKSAKGNYRFIIAKAEKEQGSIPFIRNPDNVLGMPPQNAILTTTENGPQKCIVDKFTSSDYPNASLIKPANGGYAANPNASNDGFYLLGPTTPFPNDEGNDKTKVPQVTYGNDVMKFEVRIGGSQPQNTDRFMLLLQRLACPYLPYNPLPGTDTEFNYNPKLPVNPYLTVDFLNTYDGPNPYNEVKDNNLLTRKSIGRAEPFAGHYSKLAFAPLGSNGTYKVPLHTFFRHNAKEFQPPSTLPAFHWLVHLDRQLVSPMELLQVSAYKPQELTQQFYQGNFYQHRAQWFNQTTRLYRVFEFLETRNRAAGVGVGGRIPGQINLNTVWDPEILLALLDPQDPDTSTVPAGYNSFFKPKEVQTAFNRMLELRSMTATATGLPPYALIGKDDRPFLSMGTGYSMAMGQGIDQQHPPGTRGIGINDTFLRCGHLDLNNGPTYDYVKAEGGDQHRRLFEPSPDAAGYQMAQNDAINPYFRQAMLTKLFNNVTTRSNVFGVWVTVGFFKVKDDTTFPVKLGAEIGKAEGRNIRHRMFAIVDRTNLTIDPSNPSLPGTTPPIFLAANNYNPKTGNPPAPLYHISGAEYTQKIDPVTNQPYEALVGTYEGIPWEIRAPSKTSPGTSLVFEYGINPKRPPGPNGLSQDIPVTVTKVYKEGSFGNDWYGNPSPPVFSAGDVNFMPYASPFLISLTGRGGQPVKLGNPGPQQRYNPRDYPWVVRHFSILH